MHSGAGSFRQQCDLFMRTCLPFLSAVINFTAPPMRARNLSLHVIRNEERTEGQGKPLRVSVILWDASENSSD